MIVQSIRTVGKNSVILFLLGLLCIGMVAPSQARAATDEELRNQIAELTRILQALKAQVAPSSQVTLGAAPAPVMVTDWYPDPVILGAENKSVRLLQEVLKTDPLIYPEGITSGYFGALTTKALIAFQEKFGLAATGEFTVETKFVLNYALSARSLPKDPTSYLVSAAGSTAVQAGVKELALRDTVQNGVVILSPQPVFSETIPSSDTATIQRILISGGIYRGLKVTGIMDAVTIQSVSEFLRSYGVVFTIPNNGELRADSVMTGEVVALFRKILTINAAPTIKSDLLTLPSTQPKALIPNNTRTITTLKAVRDYRANNTQVSVFYGGGVSEKFTTPVVSPNRSVATAIATKLDRPLAQITAKIRYDSVYGNDYKSILLNVYTSNEMTLDFEYKNGRTEKRYVTLADVTDFISFTYNGDREAYKRDFDLYVDKARRGEPVDRVYELVADVVNLTKDQVKEILTIKVEYYDPNDCFSSGNCSGA